MKNLVFIFLLLCTSKLFAVTEISFDYGYDRFVYGSSDQSYITTKTYHSSIAWYFWGLTAIELDFSMNDEVGREKNSIETSDSNYKLTGIHSDVQKQNYSVGLRQAFASNGSFLIPTISLGYGRQLAKSKTKIIFTNQTDYSEIEYEEPTDSESSETFYGTFALKIALRQTLYLKFSVSTIIPE
ncbi:MAG: hypothetical protein H6622_16635, partial [Halobacteriovoraceae bacterium]|nr:hypothetical protein [Halobacteriovoraceae bacterium]